jgi:hypothetical protein
MTSAAAAQAGSPRPLCVSASNDDATNAPPSMLSLGCSCAWLTVSVAGSRYVQKKEARAGRRPGLASNHDQLRPIRRPDDARDARNCRM